MTIILAVFGAVSGLIGSVTGALSLWRQHRRDKVKLRVVPVVFQSWEHDGEDGKHYTSEAWHTDHSWGLKGNDQLGLHVDIVNICPNDVTIKEVGVILVQGVVPFLRKTNRHPCAGFRFEPRRLASRDVYRVKLSLSPTQFPYWGRVHRVYALTACGSEFAATSEALDSLVANLTRTRNKGKDDNSDEVR